MPIPIAYNLRSVQRRWASSLVAVLGIAGTVAVFVAMLVPVIGRFDVREASIGKALSFCAEVGCEHVVAASGTGGCGIWNQTNQHG